MENVKDLLSQDKTPLKVRETPARGVWVEGLTEEFVTSEAEVLDLLARGEKQRSTSATGMNETSSRSHSLFVLTVTQRLKDGSTRTGKLNLGDLAGSEKVGKTGATGTTLDEAKKINQSLSALGNCINALTKEGDRGHVPYRDSKLTFILRESLGGNTKTTLIVACSPHVFNVEETVSTLRFAQRAKNITNSVSINQKRSVEELELIVKALTEEIAVLKKKLGMPPGAGRDAVALPSATLSSASLKSNDEQAEQLLVLQYELSGVRKELADVKQEMATAKLQEEAFAAERRKWEYDGEQLKRTALPQPAASGVQDLVITPTNHVLVRATTGDRGWDDLGKLDTPLSGTPLVWNGHAVLPTGNALLVLGKRGFRLNGGSEFLSPVVLGKRLVVITQDGDVSQFDP